MVPASQQNGEKGKSQPYSALYEPSLHQAAEEHHDVQETNLQPSKRLRTQPENYLVQRHSPQHQPSTPQLQSPQPQPSTPQFQSPQHQQLSTAGATTLSTSPDQCWTLQSHQTKDNEKLARQVFNKISSYISAGNFIAVLSVYGKSRYTLDSYEFFAAFMNDRGDERNKLPSLSTLRLSIFPHLLKTLFVKSDVRSFQSKSHQSRPAKPQVEMKQLLFYPAVGQNMT